MDYPLFITGVGEFACFFLVAENIIKVFYECILVFLNSWVHKV